MVPELDAILDEMEKVIDHFPKWSVSRTPEPGRCGNGGCPVPSKDLHRWTLHSDLAARALEEYLVARGVCRVQCGSGLGEHICLFKSGKKAK